MISKKMANALNKHLNNEFFAAYLYLAMSAKTDSMGLKGFAKWFYAQYEEETMHAMKFYQYILDHGEDVSLLAIEQPTIDMDTVLELFEYTLDHERSVTQYINELVDLAITEKDHATNIFLQWFVTEQVEEEATVGDIIDQLKLMGESGNGIYMLDKELGQRIFTPPAV